MHRFREIVALDFEFCALAGERQRPICVVAHELKSRRRFRLMADELGPTPPFAAGPDVLTVAYYASAEIGCYLALGWQVPPNIIDLFVEFRWLTNGLRTHGHGLLAALTYFGLGHSAAAEKKELQQALGAGDWQGRYTADEVLDYCEADVFSLDQLVIRMASRIDLPRALLRGRYMAAAAAMEWNGVPIDTATLGRLRGAWDPIRLRLIEEVDRDFGVYDGGTFKEKRFADWLDGRGIPWPKLDSGKLDLKAATFRDQAKAHLAVAPLQELRATLAELRLNDLAVGHDGRNRCLLSPFRAKTSRNQPSNSKFIFGPATWIRGLIKPPPGYGVAYIDWRAAEFAIAAVLSGDGEMVAAYTSGDPYLAFAKQAGAVPPDATKATHAQVRNVYKTVVLGVQYGMGYGALAARIGAPSIVGRDLLAAHRRVYRRFWQWSDGVVNTAVLERRLFTMFGWQLLTDPEPNPRSLANWPMQSGCAEIMRLACCLGIERGVEICAPVHDAVLICAPLDRLAEDIATMRAAMAEASQIALGGFELDSDVAITRWPDRYMDPRGEVMWARVMKILSEEEETCARPILVA